MQYVISIQRDIKPNFNKTQTNKTDFCGKVRFTLHSTTRGHTNSVSCIDIRNHKVVRVGEVGRASRQPAEAHLDILHAQDVPAVIHVLLEVFVLDKREGKGEGGREDVRRIGTLNCNSSTVVLLY